MDISVAIDRLLGGVTSEDEQYNIIAIINDEIYTEGVLAELAQCFRKLAITVDNPYEDTIDIVGTGGDGCNTLNYSTLTALAVHELGIHVAKHGNRSATGKCGSFDFLERLKISIPETVAAAESQLKSNGFTFLFAPFFHPVFAKVAAVRKRFAAEGKRTFFNVLGPLLNPAKVKRMVVGVYDKKLLTPYAFALNQLGITHAYIVYGDGLDEFSVCGVNEIIKLEDGVISEFMLHPEQLGFIRSKIDYLQAGDSFQNFEESQALLNNELLGPKQDMFILNLAMAYQVGRGFSMSMEEAVSKVRTAISSGGFSTLLTAAG
ncbi:MAG: anthranilate phosphoribosyltransferase [Francisellaceae bacterium]